MQINYLFMTSLLLASMVATSGSAFADMKIEYTSTAIGLPTTIQLKNPAFEIPAKLRSIDSASADVYITAPGKFHIGGDAPSEPFCMMSFQRINKTYKVAANLRIVSALATLTNVNSLSNSSGKTITNIDSKISLLYPVAGDKFVCRKTDGKPWTAQELGALIGPASQVIYASGDLVAYELALAREMSKSNAPTIEDDSVTKTTPGTLIPQAGASGPKPKPGTITAK